MNRALRAVVVAALTIPAAACTKQIVVSETDRLVTVVDATAPRTTGKSSRRLGLRLTISDPRTGAEDRVSLPKGSCPAWRENASAGMTILVHYVTTRPEDSQVLTSRPTSQGLRERIC
jgi:hypothetical protein